VLATLVRQRNLLNLQGGNDMAFRASNVLPSDAYLIVKRAAVQLKVNLQGFNVQLAASGADYDFLKGIYLTLKRADTQFTTLKATPGLAQYAQDQEVDPSYDVAVEFTSMQAAISGALAWMDTNVPVSVTVKPLNTWDDSTLISDTFTPAQTNGLQFELNLVIAEII